jgi:peptidoglycan/LPS O-acetylase OafA/YrhL
MRHANAFDLVRLAAAVLVILDHSWVLSGHGALLPAQLGVEAFFLLSGFLVSKSWLSDPSVWRFAARRALRIYPAYAMVIVLLALVLGPLLTTLSAADYFAARSTWSFVGHNLLIVPMQYDLPGVFGGLPYSDAVNGSLWTIRIEVVCYLGVVVVGLLGLLRRKWALVVLSLAGLVLGGWVGATGYDGVLLPHVFGADAAIPLACFALGVLARQVQFSPPWWSVAVAGGLWTLTWNTPVAALASVAFVTCLTFAVSFRSPTWLQHPMGRYDLTYGTFLFAFPVQQLFVQLGLRQPILLTLATLGVVLPLAAVSWRIIESPGMSLKPSRPLARVASGLG